MRPRTRFLFIVLKAICAACEALPSVSAANASVNGTTCHVDPDALILTSLTSSWLAAEDLEQCQVPPPSTTPGLFSPTGPDAPLETVDGFVSFEDWKKLKLSERGQDSSQDFPESQAEATAIGEACSVDEPDSSCGSNVEVSARRTESQILSYNFASPDCSARIHESSPQTQHASSLLHKSKDRYMLTPCKADQHWVAIELCDEIRVEAIELSMWEFFSSIVREFTLSVGDAEDDWSLVGTFMGKNARGNQVFYLPEPTSFHRFVRLDFTSYYGSEYYCPVSQLRVYGMNQMDAFKWEQRRTRGQEKRDEGSLPSQTVEAREQDPSPAVNESSDEQVDPSGGKISEAAILLDGVAATSIPVGPILPEVISDLNETLAEILTAASATETSKASNPETSESIYAFITRRLAALEGNTTLIARYIEHQGGSLSARFERRWQEWQTSHLTNLSTERMRHEDRLGSLASQLEQQRVSLLAMQSQLRLLADELGSERRRGIAQLLIMIVAIVLGVLTRSDVLQALLSPMTPDESAGWPQLQQRRSQDTPRTASVSKDGSSPPVKRAYSPLLSARSGSLRRKHVSHGFRSVSDKPERSRTLHGHPSASRRLARTAHLHPLALDRPPHREDHSASDGLASEPEAAVSADEVEGVTEKVTSRRVDVDSQGYLSDPSTHPA